MRIPRQLRSDGTVSSEVWRAAVTTDPRKRVFAAAAVLLLGLAVVLSVDARRHFATRLGAGLHVASVDATHRRKGA